MLALSACGAMGAASTPGGLVCPASTEKVSGAQFSPSPLFEMPQFSVQAQGDVSAFGTFTISGQAQYRRYLPAAAGNLDYTSNAGVAQPYPIRRAIVQIMNGTTPIASGLTDDSGNYSISVTATTGVTLFVRVQARSTVTSYASDGIAPNNCSGGSWDVRVVNNVTGSAASQSDPTLRAQYVLDSTTFSALASGTQTTNVIADLAFSAGSYTARAGAPFALLDTAISGLETACQGRAAINFPTLYMNWSASNTNVSGNRYDGNIGTSFFTTEGTSKIGNLYILGKTDVDTDELDNHVVAHEFGHFLENKIYRSDSIGGSHSLGDSLDPRLAFGEGFGNAFSGMVHNDPVYIDSKGTNQQVLGVKLDVTTAPSTIDDRGPWSETSMQYMLYHFWLQRGSFDRIHAILENVQKLSMAATTGLTFVSAYAQTYTLTDDDLTNTWTLAGFLASPINALCSGSCGAATPIFEPWDTDNDLGAIYYSAGSGPRKYKQSSGAMFASSFWQIYRPLVSGSNSATAHDQISFGGYSLSSANLNKYGVRRLYKVTATSATTTVSVSSISQGSENCSSGDLLDMAVYGKGVLLGLDESTSGATSNCPSVTFCSTAGQTYVVEIAGFGTVGAYNISVSP